MRGSTPITVKNANVPAATALPETIPKKPKRIWCFLSDFSNFWTNYVITFSDIENFSDFVKEVSLDTSIDEETAKKIIYDKYAKWKAEQQNI